MASRNTGGRLGKAALAIALIAPGIALIAAVAIRVAGVERAVAFDLGVMTAGRYLAWAAAALAVVAVIHALADLKARGLFAVLALAVAGATLGLYWTHPAGRTSPADVSTNPGDPPMSLAGSGALASPCDGLSPIPSQLASDRVAEVLQNLGFTITHVSLFDVTGEREAFWFREAYGVNVRIRPGRTDIRVVTHGEASTDSGAACRQALRIRTDLQGNR